MEEDTLERETFQLFVFPLINSVCVCVCVPFSTPLSHKLVTLLPPHPSSPCLLFSFNILLLWFAFFFFLLFFFLSFLFSSLFLSLFSFFFSVSFSLFFFLLCFFLSLSLFLLCFFLSFLFSSLFLSLSLSLFFFFFTTQPVHKRRLSAGKLSMGFFGIHGYLRNSHPPFTFGVPCPVLCSQVLKR